MAKRGRRSFPAAWAYLFLFWCCLSSSNCSIHEKAHIETETDHHVDLPEEVFASEEFEEPIVMCEKPEPPENGYIKGNDYSIGARVFVSCHHGYRLVGSSPMTCLAVPDPFRRVAIWDPQGERKCIENTFEDEILEDEEETSELWIPEENPYTNHAESDSEDVEEVEYGESVSEEDSSEESPEQREHDSQETAEPGQPEPHFGLTTGDSMSDTTSSHKPELCTFAKDSGPCKAFFQRYFFNMETGKCETFIYGGCRGNENNFETKEKCSEVCEE